MQHCVIVVERDRTAQFLSLSFSFSPGVPFVQALLDAIALFRATSYLKNIFLFFPFSGAEIAGLSKRKKTKLNLSLSILPRNAHIII
jgi:hypothetical protein